jgi:hypothetical protein
MNGGVWIFVMDQHEDAHKTTGRNIVLEVVRQFPLPAIVVASTSLPPDDKGDYVIIKEALRARTTKLAGEWVYDLEPGVSVHRLLVV